MTKKDTLRPRCRPRTKPAQTVKLPEKPAKEKTIHVIYKGKAACRFNELDPPEWPKGHTWVELKDMDKGNCQACKDAIKKDRA